jgi:hypothetical protein
VPLPQRLRAKAREVHLEVGPEALPEVIVLPVGTVEVAVRMARKAVLVGVVAVVVAVEVVLAEELLPLRRKTGFL